MIVYPQRFGMNLPRGLMLFFYKFIPKPDKTFFLWCTPDEITARKQEYTNEEILLYYKNPDYQEYDV